MVLKNSHLWMYEAIQRHASLSEGIFNPPAVKVGMFANPREVLGTIFLRVVSITF